jgi:hypothetical protein
VIEKGDLTPGQHRVGRAAARVYEERWASLFACALFLVPGAYLAFGAHNQLARDPEEALLSAGYVGAMLMGAVSTLVTDPFVRLAGRLYRELEGAGSLGGGAPAVRAPAPAGLSPKEQRMVESAQRIGRLGWGSVRAAVLVVLASGVVTVAAALARFGSEAGGLAAAALGMAAAGGLSVGVAIGLLILTPWMRLAEHLGGPPGDAGTTP